MHILLLETRHTLSPTSNCLLALLYKTKLINRSIQVHSYLPVARYTQSPSHWGRKSTVGSLINLSAPTLSRVRLFAALWTVALQAPLSMGFPRQEHWSGFQFPSPEDTPNRRIKPTSPAWQAGSLPQSHQGSLRIWHILFMGQYMAFLCIYSFN